MKKEKYEKQTVKMPRLRYICVASHINWYEMQKVLNEHKNRARRPATFDKLSNSTWCDNSSR